MTEQTARERTIDKIRKLLALATSSNQNEAQAAAEKAQALMIEHSVAEADVAAAEGRAIIVTDNVWMGKCAPWQRALWSVVSIGTDTELVFIQGGREGALALVEGELISIPANHFGVHIFGLELNVETAKQMFEFLNTNLERVANYKVNDRIDFTSSPRTWKVSFLQGAVNSLYKRMKQRRDAIDGNSHSGQALVVTNKRVLERRDEVYPKLRSGGRTAAPKSGDGMREGSDYGATMDLGGKTVEGGRGQLGSGR